MPRGRTRLTTPPGEEPAPAAGPGADRAEVYAPGFALPEEPTYPSRFRWLVVTATVLALVAAIAFAVTALTSASRTFDPSLEAPGAATPAP